MQLVGNVSLPVALAVCCNFMDGFGGGGGGGWVSGVATWSETQYRIQYY